MILATGVGRNQPQGPRDLEEEAEGHAEDAGEDGEAQGQTRKGATEGEGERGAPQRQQACQQGLHLLRSTAISNDSSPRS